MEKIITLFQRNYETDRLVRDEVTPGAHWVIEGEGVPTRKLDGTACMVRGGKLYKRYELKRGKTAPPDFEPAQEPDAVTGDIPGWVPVGDAPEDRWHREAWENGNAIFLMAPMNCLARKCRAMRSARRRAGWFRTGKKCCKTCPATTRA